MTLSPFRSEITSNDARLLVLATEFSGETGDRLNRLLTSRSPVEAAAPDVRLRPRWEELIMQR